MNKVLGIFTIVIMFFFKSNLLAQNEKSIYDLNIKSIDGKNIELVDYKDKAILIVNVASYCGFTKQYSDLQKLWDLYKDKGLIVIGIPSKTFNQEKETERK